MTPAFRLILIVPDDRVGAAMRWAKDQGLEVEECQTLIEKPVERKTKALSKLPKLRTQTRPIPKPNAKMPRITAASALKTYARGHGSPFALMDAVIAIRAIQPQLSAGAIQQAAYKNPDWLKRVAPGQFKFNTEGNDSAA